MFDYSKLRGRIREICGTDAAFAALLKIDRATLSKKLNNRSDFSQDEIRHACVILAIPTSDVASYFFRESVA